MLNIRLLSGNLFLYIQVVSKLLMWLKIQHDVYEICADLNKRLTVIAIRREQLIPETININEL